MNMKNKKDPFDLKPIPVTKKRASLALKRLAKFHGISIKKTREIHNKIAKEVMEELNSAED